MGVEHSMLNRSNGRAICQHCQLDDDLLHHTPQSSHSTARLKVDLPRYKSKALPMTLA